MDEAEHYHLSKIIPGHASDIKCLTTTAAGAIITGSRDESVKFFAKKRGEYDEVLSFQQEKGLQVNTVGYFESADGWMLFVGRKDGSLSVYRSGSSEPVATLRQHSGNISSMHVDATNKKLLTGSWDFSAIIWPIDEITNENFPAYKLEGHTLSVWALASFEASPGYYLTASADKSIKMWNNDVQVKTFLGHTDVVRALLVLSNDQFISASNDATIRMWHTESGACLGKFNSQSEELIYGMCGFGPLVITCGERGHFEVWKQIEASGAPSLENQQVVFTPAVSAWACSSLPNNDIAVAGSDGKVYIFTTDTERRAPSTVIDEFDSQVAAHAAKHLERMEREGQEEIVIRVALDDGAPQLELRYKKGSDPSLAAEKFIIDNNLPISYLNEVTDYIVANVPEARMAQAKKYKKQPTQRVTVDGVEYDHAFDVTLEDGRTRKLPYNMGDDPDYCAQMFCEKYNLPIKFIGQISQLLRREAGTSTTAAPRAVGEYLDPFTGGGRYVPGQSGPVGTDFADPLTGGGRYIPGSVTSGNSSAGDPYTSGGRYIPGAGSAALVPNSSIAQDKTRPSGELVPINNCFIFEASTISLKAINKLRELNESEEAFKLNDSQIQALEILVNNSESITPVETEIVSGLDLGLQWPLDKIFVVLDILRGALLHNNINQYFCDVKGHGAATYQKLCALLICEPPEPVRICICRVISNACAHSYGQEMVLLDFSQMVPLVAREFNSSRPFLQVAAATVVANWSCLLLKNSAAVAELGRREDVLRALIKVLEPVDSFGTRDQVASVRMLQAIVTLMWGDRQVIQLGKSRELASIIRRFLDAVGDEGGKNVARDINEMLLA